MHKPASQRETQADLTVLKVHTNCNMGLHEVGETGRTLSSSDVRNFLSSDTTNAPRITQQVLWGAVKWK